MSNLANRLFKVNLPSHGHTDHEASLSKEISKSMGDMICDNWPDVSFGLLE